MGDGGGRRHLAKKAEPAELGRHRGQGGGWAGHVAGGGGVGGRGGAGAGPAEAGDPVGRPPRHVLLGSPQGE